MKMLPILCNEQVILIRDQIAGTLSLPTANVASEPYPLVLMLPGFASVRDEVGNLFQSVACLLAERGIASLRIDFRGWGGSAGEMSETTVPGMIGDAIETIDFLAALPKVDSTRVSLLGFSFGGGIAVAAACQRSSLIKSMVLWAPLAKFEESSVLKFRANAKSEQVTIDLGWRTIVLRDEFFESLNSPAPEELIQKFTGDLLCVVGSSDPLIGHSSRLCQHVKQAETYVIQGADHIFGALLDHSPHKELLFLKTCQWFNKSFFVGREFPIKSESTTASLKQ